MPNEDDPFASLPPLSEKQNERIRKELYAPRSRAELSGALRDMARAVRRQMDQPADPLSPYHFYHEMTRLLEIVRWAEQADIIEGWIKRIQPKPKQDFEDGFPAFATMAEEEFGSLAKEPPPAGRRSPLRWAWALELAADGLWQQEVAKAQRGVTAIEPTPQSVKMQSTSKVPTVGFMGIDALCQYFSIADDKRDALRKRLERFRNAHAADGDAFTEHDAKAANESRYLYNPSKIKQHVQDLIPT